MTEDEQREVCELAEKILCELSKRKTRATYGAVGCILGAPAWQVSDYLGCRRPKASWVVAKTTNTSRGSKRGKPTGYKPCQLAEGLCKSPLKETCSELREFLGWPLDNTA